MRRYHWLEALRLKEGMTQAEVAKRSGIDRTYYTKIERGKVPSVRVAMRIANVLGFEWTLFFELSCDVSSQKERDRSQSSTDEGKKGRT
ncbi:helix-turn-helix domain-containing protein [Brevibacillus humidisoli]|uniref:helix-turn-helix transcriptional regulator n=1 Tax=Brevibacillus humidisoli TaxID=2895522 RepID=UPI001E28D59A|nr:helix-turn-helix transcriptional regulator [Brevibacillus humidisoli]UFJ41415.1 helix-turn-helix domain-containing protein [Brevibacillus humidisoli]